MKETFVSEAEYIEGYVERMTETCRWLERLVRVLGILSIVLAVSVPALSILYYYSPGQYSSLSLEEILNLVPCCVLVIVVALVSMRLMSWLAAGESPFTMKFVRSLYVLVGALAAFGLLEFALSLYGMGGLPALNPNVVNTISASGLAMVSLLTAGVVFLLAFVFRYGVILQQQSEYLV